MTIDHPVPGRPLSSAGVGGHSGPPLWPAPRPDPLEVLVPASQLPSPPMKLPLPPVRPDSRDADPAKKTPASKEDARKAVGALPGKLSACLAALKAAISRCERNLATVARDQKKIKSEGARDHYSQAEAKLEQEHSRLLGIREHVHQLAVSMNDALNQVMNELGAGVKSRRNQPSSGKPVNQPKAAKPAAHAPDSKPPGKDAELDGLSKIDLQRRAASMVGLDPETAKKAKTKKSDQS